MRHCSKTGPEHWKRSSSTLTDLPVNWDAEDLTSLSKKVSEESLELFPEIQKQAEQKRRVVLHSYFVVVSSEREERENKTEIAFLSIT